MSLMSSKEYTHDKELQNMLKEIQHSLSTHLTNILTPIFNEKKDIHDILLRRYSSVVQNLSRPLPADPPDKLLS